jgi:hypothetical protein
MFDQFNYLVAGAGYQIVGISLPTLLDPGFLDRLVWFYTVLFALIFATLWISELPGDILNWFAEQFRSGEEEPASSDNVERSGEEVSAESRVLSSQA